MTLSDPRSQLEALGREIEQVQERLKLKGIFSADHQLKQSELRARHLALTRKLNAGIAQDEAAGHHVSALEASVRHWLNSLSLDLD